jgi:hypothetical protein
VFPVISSGIKKRLEELIYTGQKYSGKKTNDYPDFIIKIVKPPIDKM